MQKRYVYNEKSMADIWWLYTREKMKSPRDASKSNKEAWVKSRPVPLNKVEEEPSKDGKLTTWKWRLSSVEAMRKFDIVIDKH